MKQHRLQPNKISNASAVSTEDILLVKRLLTSLAEFSDHRWSSTQQDSSIEFSPTLFADIARREAT
jgi:hypothetical protein